MISSGSSKVPASYARGRGVHEGLCVAAINSIITLTAGFDTLDKDRCATSRDDACAPGETQLQSARWVSSWFLLSKVDSIPEFADLPKDSIIRYRSVRATGALRGDSKMDDAATTSLRDASFRADTRGRSPIRSL